MDLPVAFSWFDVFISVVVMLGIFGVLANLIHFYDKGGHH